MAIGITVRHIKSKIEDAARIGALLDMAGIPYHSIECVNWPKEYPDKPEVKFRIAYTDDSILLEYLVSEKTARAAARYDGDNVWEDSCCEFFLQPKDSDYYFNLECNCAGTLLIAKGKTRADRELLPADAMSRVQRFSTLSQKQGSTRFEEISVSSPWRLSLVIPYEIFGITDLTGAIHHANFYKCGDSLSTPHFLSWTPIDTPAPNFHQPSSFAPLYFLQPH